MSWYTSKLRIRLACLETGLSPPVKYFYWLLQGWASFVGHLCYFCLAFVRLPARLFISALWSPAGKRLTSWLLFVMSNCEVVTSYWYPWSGVVLVCIDPWYLPYSYFAILYKCAVELFFKIDVTNTFKIKHFEMRLIDPYFFYTHWKSAVLTWGWGIIPNNLYTY